MRAGLIAASAIGLLALFGIDKSLTPAAAAACTEKEAKSILAAFDRAEKAFDKCTAAVNSSSSAEKICRDCRKARDLTRVANRRTKSFANACGAAGDTEGAKELQEATHLVDQLSYLIKNEVLNYCPGGG